MGFGKYRLQKSFKSFSNSTVKETIQYSGILGTKIDGSKKVEVPQRPGFVYVRLRDDQNELIMAYNGVVSPVFGLPVLVSRKADDKNKWYVLGRDVGRYANWGNSAYLPNHGAQHSFDPNNPGGDPVWVWNNQFMPLNGLPSGTDGSLNLVIEPSYYYINNERIYLGLTGSMDLSSHLPSANKSRFVLIYGDIHGNPGVVDGPEFTSGTTVYQSYIPQLTGTMGVPIRAVRLEQDTTFLSWDSLIDVRPFYAVDYLSGSSSGGGGGSTSGTTLPLFHPDRGIFSDISGTLSDENLFRYEQHVNDTPYRSSLLLGSSKTDRAGNPNSPETYMFSVTDNYGEYGSSGSGSYNYPFAAYTFGDTPAFDWYTANGTQNKPLEIDPYYAYFLSNIYAWDKNQYTPWTGTGSWFTVAYWEVLATENNDYNHRGSEFDFFVGITGSVDLRTALEMGASYAYFGGSVFTAIEFGFAENGLYWGKDDVENSWRYFASGSIATAFQTPPSLVNVDLQQRRSNGTWRTAMHHDISGTSIGDVEGGNYTRFESNGYPTFKGSATYWDDVQPYTVNPGTGLTALSSKQYGTTGFTMYYWSDNHSADETYQAFFQIPHKYKAGTDGHFHIHVIPSQNGAGGNNTVVYVAKYQWVNIGDAYNTSTNGVVSGTFTIGASDANKHLLFEFPELPGTGKTRSSDLMVQVSRLSKTSAADNYTGDLYLRFTDTHIECDRLGTDDES